MSKQVTKTDLSDSWVCGVLGGVGKAYGFNPFLLRLGYLALIFFTSGAFFLLYLSLALFMPSEKRN